MILDMFKLLLVRKYYGYKIYIHNLAKFDSTFLLLTLINIPGIKPVIISREDDLIFIKVHFDLKKDKNSYNGSITIYDSYLILPSSLDKLSKVFC